MNTLTRLAATVAMATGLAGIALPGQAADRIAPAGLTGHVQLAANDEQNGYVEKAQREMSEWKDKIVKFSRDTKEKGKDAADKAGDKLTNAWDEVERNWRKLKEASKDAGEKGWNEAKKAYEASKDKLQKTWDEVAS